MPRIKLLRSRRTRQRHLRSPGPTPGQERRIRHYLRQKRSSRAQFERLTYEVIAARVSTTTRPVTKNAICGWVRRKGLARHGKNSHWRGR